MVVRILRVVQGFHHGQEVLGPGENMYAVDVLKVVTPETFGEAGNVGQLLGRYFLPGFRVGNSVCFWILDGFGKDECRWFRFKDDPQDDVFVFDAKREVGAVFEDLPWGPVSTQQEADFNPAVRVWVVLGAELVPGKVPQGQRFFAVGGEFDGAGVVEDVSADQVVNGDDPEADFFQYQEAVVDVGCLCLLAGEVPDSGFGQQLAKGKERLCVVGYVQECMNDILEQSADGLLHSGEGFAVLRVWGFQGLKKVVQGFFVEDGGKELVVWYCFGCWHGCRVSAFRSCQGSLRPRPIRSGAWRRWPEVSDYGWCWGRRGS